MTDVICTMKDCIHRSKVPMRKFAMTNGEKCYKCTLKEIVIRDLLELELYELIDEDLPCCNRYERKEEQQTMKVKIITSENYKRLEEDINAFIKNKNVIDIKYKETLNVVMVIYKEIPPLEDRMKMIADNE